MPTLSVERLRRHQRDRQPIAASALKATSSMPTWTTASRNARRPTSSPLRDATSGARRDSRSASRGRGQRRPQRAARALVEPKARVLRRRHHDPRATRSNASTSSRANFQAACISSPAIRARSCPGSRAARAELGFRPHPCRRRPHERSLPFGRDELHPHEPRRERPAPAARRCPRQLDFRHLLRVRRRAGDLTTETFFGDWEEAGRNVLAQDRMNAARLCRENVLSHERASTAADAANSPPSGTGVRSIRSPTAAWPLFRRPAPTLGSTATIRRLEVPPGVRLEDARLDLPRRIAGSAIHRQRQTIDRRPSRTCSATG